MTLAAWAKPSTAHVGVILGLGASDGVAGNNRKVLYWNSDSTIHMRNQVSGSSADIAASGTGTAGSWLHGAAVFAGSTDYRVFRNGANKNTSSTSISWGSPSNTLIGYDNAATTYFNGDVGECGIWSVALDDGMVWRLYDPGTRFELWYPLRSRKWFTQASGSSGTSATTNANDTSSASGTTTVVGTSAKTNANDTSSASGTTTVLGTSATTNAADTSSASGTTTIVGTSATANAADTSSASGTVGSSGSTGTVSVTNANDTASASGTTTVVGNAAVTNAADTASASGWAGVVSGTSDTTNANDTASASGSAGEARSATGAGRSRRRRPYVVEIDGHDFVVNSEEEAAALLENAKEEAEQVARQAIERAAKVKVRPVRKVIADARKSLALPDIKAPGLEDYAAQITQHIEELYQDALRTIEIAALIAKREREDEDDEDILLLMA